MKVKNFEQYLESRLNKTEIAELKYQAQIEFEMLKNLQTNNVHIVVNHTPTQKKNYEISKTKKIKTW